MSPRSESQWKEIRAASRKKILDSGLELFAKQGYHNTSVQQIAKRAGVAKGLVYNYFPSKEALLKGIVEEGIKEPHHIMSEIHLLEAPNEKLRKLIEISFEYIIDRYEHFKLVLSLSMQLDQFPQLTDMVRTGYSDSIPSLSELMKSLNIDQPLQEARLLAAMMDGIGLQYVVTQKSIPIEEIKTYLIQKYCQ